MDKRISRLPARNTRLASSITVVVVLSANCGYSGAKVTCLMPCAARRVSTVSSDGSP
ncbi:hypothetical protein D3C86_2077300 [compost metagenome]